MGACQSLGDANSVWFYLNMLHYDYQCINVALLIEVASSIHQTPVSALSRDAMLLCDVSRQTVPMKLSNGLEIIARASSEACKMAC
jgi:hypothetical protein